MSIRKKTFSNNKFTATYFIERDNDGMRLDQFLQIFYPTFSRQNLKKKISDGEVTIQGRPGKHRSSTKVHHNELITITIYKTSHEDEYWLGQKLELETVPEIVFEDDDIVIISKPPFMATHPTGKHLFNCATTYFENKFNSTVHSIHRIDRETSGILLLGKNPKVAALLTTAFEQSTISKCYFFISKIMDNANSADIFSEDARLAATETGLKRVYINHFPADSSDGKKANTKFVILHRERGYALGLAFPVTGRQHQIRVHAMINGLPLIGDKIYYGSFEMFQRFKDQLASEEEYNLMELPRHALHALSINIPYQQKKRTFCSKIPNDLTAWIKSKLTLNISVLEQQIQDQLRG